MLAGLRIILVAYLSTVVPWLMAMPMEMSPNIPTTDAVRVPHTADNITRRKMKRGCGANHFACSYEPDLAGDDPGGSGCGCCGCCVGSDCNCPPNTLSPVGTKSIEGCIAAPNHFGPPGKAATPCSAGSSSSAGATSGTQCKCITATGHYQKSVGTATTSTSCAACRSRSSCPQGKYLTGTCGGFTDYVCEPCPLFSGTAAAGATSIGQCMCASGYFDRHPSSTSVTCLPCKASCPRGQHLTGTCSTSDDLQCTPCLNPKSCVANTYLSGTCAGQADYICSPCPAHSTGPTGATEASQCVCVPGYYDVDSAALGVNCTECRMSCKTGQYLSTKCGPVDTAHGEDATCAQCPAHATLMHNSTSRRRAFAIAGVMNGTPPLIQDCVCDPGYYDELPALSQVNCTAIPPQFSTGATKTAKCQIQKFGAGQKQQIKLDLSPSNTAQLGAMVQFLKGVSTDLLYSVDFNHACAQLLLQYKGDGSLCSKSFPLFAKNGNSATHVKFLGTATLQCNGYSDLFVLSKVCVEPCIHDDSQGCCWVPPVLAPYFTCCGKYGCCPATTAPTPPPIDTAISVPECKDLHSNCPHLKARLDTLHASCFNTDLGSLLGNSTYNGMHLVDQCCASCHATLSIPATDGYCAMCLARGHTQTRCTLMGVCHCTYSAQCLQCTGHTDDVTAQECESYGIDCSSNCTNTTRASVKHRRAQGGATAAVQVQANGHSTTLLTRILNCLGRGNGVASCGGPTKCADRHDSGFGQPCAAFSSYCADPVLAPKLKKNCKKTCGLCDTAVEAS